MKSQASVQRERPAVTTGPQVPTKPPVFIPPVRVTAESVPDGKVIDFLTGEFVNDTPEEYVRQNVERDIVRRLEYESTRCRPEYRIKVGSSRKAVDIAVFDAGADHTQENIRLIVECKRPGTSPHDRREGIDQLKSYLAACVNAEFGLWTNGDDRYSLAKRSRDGSHVFDEIVDIPGAHQSEADLERPSPSDLRPATADNLLFAFRRCHNYIAGTEGMHKTEAFWELLKVIFCKIEDERSRSLDFYVTPKERSSTTSAGSAKSRLDKLFKSKVIKKYPAIFASAESQSIQLKANTVAFVVSQLQGYSLLRSSVDVKGKAYEEIVGSNLRGDRGEFFTPRNACRMAVDMLNPQPGERILDPACGTGGFLITAMNHALDLLEVEEKAEWVDVRHPTEFEISEYHNRRHDYLAECVFGLDLNPALVRAAKMNMVMNNDGSGGLWQANSLASPHEWHGDTSTAVPLGSIDVLVSNPPFGANIVIDDEEVLKQYELASVWDQDDDGRWDLRRDNEGRTSLQKSQPPEVLFIERCVQFLREGTGRMAIVLPNGILNNPALGYVREWLLRNTQIVAVVDMARELFQPKNDTQTSMVMLRRLAADERQAAQARQLDYPVFMAVAERIGHDKRGNTLYRRNSSGDDVLAERLETTTELDPETGVEYIRESVVRERLVDDELPEVARAFMEWLSKEQ